jgi:hypothetical protein
MAEEPSDGTGDIIIKGSSVHVEFDSAVYPAEPGGKHGNNNRKITKIVVKDDKGNEKFSAADSKGGLKWTVTVFTEKQE